MTRRAGVTLVELLVGVVLTASLFLLGFALLGQMQRTVQRGAVRSESWSRLAGGVQLLRDDLAEVSPGDVLVMEPSRIVYRAWRGTGISCGRTIDGILLRTSRFQALRLPSAGRDSLSIFRDVQTTGSGWYPMAITGPPRSGVCTDGTGAAALVVPTPITDSLVLPVPVRFFEVMEIRLYQSGGRWWVGARSVSNGEVIQPVMGPVASSGLQFQFLDQGGGSISSPTALSRITVRLTTTMDDRDALSGAASGGVGRRDSMLATVRQPWRFR